MAHMQNTNNKEITGWRFKQRYKQNSAICRQLSLVQRLAQRSTQRLAHRSAPPITPRGCLRCKSPMKPNKKRLLVGVGFSLCLSCSLLFFLWCFVVVFFFFL